MMCILTGDTICMLHNGYSDIQYSHMKALNAALLTGFYRVSLCNVLNQLLTLRIHAVPH